MKKMRIRLACFLLVLLVMPSKGQQVDSVLSYYPIQQGDSWLYLNADGYHGQYYRVIEVVADTVMSNGKTYAIFRDTRLSDGLFSNTFRRLDSSTACVYQWYPDQSAESQVESLMVTPAPGGRGPSIGFFANFGQSQVWCSAIFADTVLGHATASKSFSGYVYSPIYKLSKGLGLTSWSLDDGQNIVRQWLRLDYARIGGNEYGTPLAVEGLDALPSDYVLSQNFPNPFNPSTDIEFTIPRRSHVRLSIWNLIGQEVDILIESEVSAGRKVVRWKSHVSSGVYLCRLVATPLDGPSVQIVRSVRMTLLR